MTSKSKPRSNLEIFLLALVQANVRTPYDMMIKAGVSLGSSLPALNRLVADRLLGVSEGHSRRKRIFATKTFGSVVLGREWKEQMAKPHDDLDSIVRTAALAWARGGEEKCGEFLNECGGRLKKKLKSEQDGFDENAPGARSGLLERYSWLRKSLELRRKQAEIDGIFALSREIWPTAKRGKSRATNRGIEVQNEKA